MSLEFVRRNKAATLLFFYLLFSVICLTIRVDPYVNGLKSVIWFLISPDVVYSGRFFNKLDSLKGRVFSLVSAEAENHILRDQNIELAKRSLQSESLELENNRLRSLLNLKERTFPESIVAEVVGYDPREWFHSIIINKGATSGVVLSAAVMAPSVDKPVLVGRVVDVSENSSKVLLITDVVSAVSVEVSTRADLGLLEGQNRPWIAINYLGNQSTVQPGDFVQTAGLGGVFPPGIPVGKVIDVSNTDEGFFKTARVQPEIDFGSLKEVLVLHRAVSATLPLNQEKHSK